MTLNDGVAWGTIVGGIAGFLSFAWVVFDKISSKPKLITSIRKAIFQNQGGGPGGGEPRVYFSVNLEVGNLGTEPTTITQVHLELSGGKILDAKGHQPLSGGRSLIVDDHSTRVCEKGIASVEHLIFYVKDMVANEAKLEGTLILTLIGGAKYRQAVAFLNNS